MEKIATRISSVEAVSLPPTSSAAKYHSKRVYLQIQQWKDPKCDLNPKDWGWFVKDGGLFPILTDIEPAPQELLKIIRCSCTSDCSKKTCSCRKYNKECSVVCTNCKGTACTNAQKIEDDIEAQETLL